jgi:hypothetical protein
MPCLGNFLNKASSPYLIIDNFSGKRLQVIAIVSAIAASAVAGAFVASPALLFKNVPQAYSQEYATLAD